ncbi:hypothetical protein [Methylobacterium organophilum]|uniref:Uncharacterized protein n=1 Tax=Methylobacterium organophilum TaxID=410 RepID=A0ABQ4TA25_METOR|nr:hypothetical protein [Methylobacterium organophilum]GJE28512.1 hypothetical protein LKMONMHP_3384 [Methylobacterium organophilum]
MFEIRVQLGLDLDTMPIEDASQSWDEEVSPYRTTARLVLLPQDGLAEAKRTFADDVLSFWAAQSLAARQPSGSLMSAPLKTYQALSRFRHARNQVAKVEPRSVSDVPA